MSTQFRFVQSYAEMVRAYLRMYPEDEAVARAVGGDHEMFGVFEHSLLRQFGMRDTASVIDVGCGAGRLTRQLERYPGIDYLGIDVVPELLAYTRRKVARPDFQLVLSPGNALPVPDGEADFVTFFSVFTHILHEESFAYLQHCWRALAPGGRVLFSFFEYDCPDHWPTFLSNVDWVHQRSYLGHINIFMHRTELQLWAQRLGFRVVAFVTGNEPHVVVTAETATDRIQPGRYPLGQSLCVLEKPRR